MRQGENNVGRGPSESCWSFKRQHRSEDEMQVSNPSPKRRRCADNFFFSPKLIALSETPKKSERVHLSNSMTFVMSSPPPPSLSGPSAAAATPSVAGTPSCSTEQEHVSQKEKNGLEWWKQKTRPLTRPSEICSSNPLCSVCQCTIQLRAVPSTPRQPSPKSVMPDNALLAYLTTPSGIQSLAPVASLPVSSLDLGDCCSFCERSVCPDCLASCDDCSASFCTFCRTTDYNATVSREVCLDCNQRVLQLTNCEQDDDDAMNID